MKPHAAHPSTAGGPGLAGYVSGIIDRRPGAAIHTLALRWHDHRDLAARDELVQRFMPLVRRLALRYAKSNEPVDDLVQVAAVGLLDALERYDPRGGARFTAFAVPTILGALKRHFRQTGWVVHVPRPAQEMALRIEHGADQLIAETGRAPTAAELAGYLNAGADEVVAALQAARARHSVSLDAPAPGGESGDEPLSGCLGDADDRYGLVEATVSVAATMARLPRPEARALALAVTSDMTQAEIASRLGCSQMNISRLLARARGRLRYLRAQAPADS
jgi:RNA polymerase sigma-B factor